MNNKNRLKAIVVGVGDDTDERVRLEQDLDELESLLRTLSVETISRVIQLRHRLVARSLLGEGKVEEIKQLAAEHKADMVVFDRELSAVQVRNLEKDIGCAIYDRAGIILEIFSEHAQTNQAKTQVEIAKLEYLLPRLSGAWTHFQRQKGGGFASRGMGEKQIEIDRRRTRERIARLQKKLQDIRQDRRTQAKSRQSELKVALVGYTNSGKTTLMSALTKIQEEGKDELFATLDASIKVIDPRTRPKILLSDTVGFIRNLPTSLIESFKSTLDHVVEADLLVHIVDVSSENFKDQMETTISVLAEIGAGAIPHILVFNKSDRLDDLNFPRILRKAYPSSICVSAFNADDAKRLREHIYDFFQNNMARIFVRIPYDNHEAVSLLYKSCLILESDYSQPEGILFFIQATKPTAEKLKPFTVPAPEPVAS